MTAFRVFASDDDEGWEIIEDEPEVEIDDEDNSDRADEDEVIWETE